MNEVPTQLPTVGNYLISILGPAPESTEVNRNFSIAISGLPIQSVLLLISSVVELTKYAWHVSKPLKKDLVKNNHGWVGVNW